MLNKEQILNSLHSALLSKIIYKINKKSEYNEKESFIENVEDIVPYHGKTFSLLNKYFPDDEFVRFISCAKTGLQSLITINKTEKEIYVTFRGTETDSWADIFTNLMMNKIDIGGCYVHMGYYRQLTYKNYDVAIADELQKLADKYYNYKVIVSGHSMASGLSIMFTYFLVNYKPELIPKLSVYRFGSPRVCNKELFDVLIKNKIKIYSFIYKNDIVQLVFPFYYYTYPRYILSDDWYYLLTNEGDTSINKYKSGFGNNYIKDHNMVNYVNSLCNIYNNY